jgi:hypothetical protein
MRKVFWGPFQFTSSVSIGETASVNNLLSTTRIRLDTTILPLLSLLAFNKGDE